MRPRFGIHQEIPAYRVLSGEIASPTPMLRQRL
jgi:hypothetical protein